MSPILQNDGNSSENSSQNLFGLYSRTVVCKCASGSMYRWGGRLDMTLIEEVTGGMGGLGSALAKTLLIYGADVVVTDLAPAPKSSEWRESCGITHEDVLFTPSQNPCLMLPHR